jgi:hypothetical protein
VGQCLGAESSDSVPRHYFFLRKAAAGVRAGLLLAVLALNLALSLPARSEDAEKRAGFFISAGGRGLAYRGDLNGNLALWHFDLAFYIPKLGDKISTSFGFGILHASWMWELDYLRSDLTASVQGRGTPAHFQAIQITGRQFLLKDSTFQPYVSLGISVPWLRVDGGAELNGQKLQAAYIGLEAVLGAGLEVRISPAVFVHGGAAWRLGGFFYASGEGKGRDLMALSSGQGGPRWGRWLRTSSLGLDFGLGFVF